MFTYPVGMIPWSAMQLNKSSVSFFRIKHFINETEINPNDIQNSPNQSEDPSGAIKDGYSIEISNMMFQWPSRK